jgi:hypothetical protein
MIDGSLKLPSGRVVDSFEVSEKRTGNATLLCLRRILFQTWGKVRVYPWIFRYGVDG